MAPKLVISLVNQMNFKLCQIQKIIKPVIPTRDQD